MTPLKIVLVEFSPIGGLFHFAFGLGRAMAERGHEVELITGDRPELTSDVSGFTVTPLLPSCPPDHPPGERALMRTLRRAACGVRYLEGWRRVLRRLDARPADIVQWSDWRFALDGWLVVWAARRRASAVQADVAHTPRPLQEQRRDGPLHKSGPLLRRALAAAYARMDVVFVLGERSRTELMEAWPQLERVEVIPHGDLDVLRGAPVPDAGDSPPAALFFGTWTRYKGLDVLLEAFALVRSRKPDATLTVAGAVGGDIDYEAITRRATEIGGVHLRPGYVPVGEIAGLMNEARVVVAPYRDANQSGVVHLAQTFARPVVATEVGDLPEAVREGNGGLLVPPGDVRAFAVALETVLGDPARATEMGRRGRERLERESSWGAVAERMLEVYEELAGSRR